MKELGSFEIKDFSKIRQMLSEVYEESIKERMIGLVELNVDKARKSIKTHEIETGEKISFTGWLIKCISQAVSEDKEVHAYRWKKNKIIIFDNVHVSVMVERTAPSGKKVPINHVIKHANTKSVLDITNEIREIQKREISEKNQLVEGTPKYYSLLYSIVPKFLRRYFIRKKLNNTQFFIENAGTVSITSVGMFTKNLSGWAIPFTSSTLNIAVGGIKLKPIFVNGKLEEHEFLNLTIQIDHNIVDGAPAARFVSRLTELIESGFAL